VALERQALAQSSLVDLDREAAGGLEVCDLVLYRQGDLRAGVLARLVVADERPLQDRDRSGEHPVHRPLGERLRVAPPADGHRTWA